MVNGEHISVKGLSQAAIGRALKMSPANVTKLKKQGMPVDSVESAQAWRDAKQNIAARIPTPEESRKQFGRVGGDDSHEMIRAHEETADGFEVDEDHDAARTRLRISEANLSEMKEAEERGSLIRVDAIKAALGTAMATAREALLQIPSRLAPLLAADQDPANIQNTLHGEIHQALEHLSGASERLGQPMDGLK